MSGVILIDDFATAREALRSDTFAAVDLAGYLRLLQKESGVDLSSLVHLADNTPFFLDGPRHRMLHVLSSRFLVASRLEAWRPLMEAAVDEYLDRLHKKAAIELVSDYINPLFRTITGQVLGFDAMATDEFPGWIQQTRDLLEPMRSLRQIARLQRAIGEMMEYIGASPCLRSPGSPRSVRDQLMDELSEKFTREDALALLAAMFVASQTTSQTLSNVVFHVLRMPIADRTVYADPVWCERNLETLLRLHSSPQYVDRIAKCDQRIGSACFHAGDHLHIHLASVNRDKNMFEDEGSGAVRRVASAGHLSFGAGEHRCPGATYARMTIGIALPRLFARFPQLALCEEPEWEDTTFIRAPTSLICTSGL